MLRRVRVDFHAFAKLWLNNVQTAEKFFHNLISSHASMWFSCCRRALSARGLDSICYFMCYVVGEVHQKGLILALGKQSSVVVDS